jgi:hypothetical protein
MAGEPGTGGGAPAGEMPAAWMEQIQETVGKLINGAISSRDKQADKKREQDKLDFKKMLEETVAGASKAGASEEPQGGGKNKDKENVELASLKKQLTEYATRADAFERQANDEKTRRRQQDLQKGVLDSLATFGIDGLRAKAAFAMLKERIRHQDEDADEIVMTGEDGVAMDLPIALRTWSKSEEAKIFLPPNGSKGSGSRPGGQTPFGGQKPTVAQQSSILNELLDRNLT